MTQGRSVLLIVAGIILIVLSVNFMADCSRKNKAEKPEKARVKIINEDSLKTAITKKFIARENRIIDSMAKVNERNRKFYASKVRKDVAIEKEYQLAPSLPLCDSALKSKNERIAAAENIIVGQDTTIAAMGRKITLQSGLITDKDKTIADLNRGWENTNVQLAKALQPKRIGLGVFVGVAFDPTLKPKPVIGIGASYNLIRF